jgi:hypothetical protein
MGGGHGPGAPQLEGTFWNTELSHQVRLVTLLCYIVADVTSAFHCRAQQLCWFEAKALFIA